MFYASILETEKFLNCKKSKPDPETKLEFLSLSLQKRRYTPRFWTQLLLKNTKTVEQTAQSKLTHASRVISFVMSLAQLSRMNGAAHQ